LVDVGLPEAELAQSLGGAQLDGVALVVRVRRVDVEVEREDWFYVALGGFEGALEVLADHVWTSWSRDVRSHGARARPTNPNQASGHVERDSDGPALRRMSRVHRSWLAS